MHFQPPESKSNTLQMDHMTRVPSIIQKQERGGGEPWHAADIIGGDVLYGGFLFGVDMLRVLAVMRWKTELSVSKRQFSFCGKN